MAEHFVVVRSLAEPPLLRSLPLSLTLLLALSRAPPNDLIVQPAFIVLPGAPGRASTRGICVFFPRASSLADASPLPAPDFYRARINPRCRSRFILQLSLIQRIPWNVIITGVYLESLPLAPPPPCAAAPSPLLPPATPRHDVVKIVRVERGRRTAENRPRETRGSPAAKIVR